jgi:hypothetical protein
MLITAGLNMQGTSSNPYVDTLSIFLMITKATTYSDDREIMVPDDYQSNNLLR